MAVAVREAPTPIPMMALLAEGVGMAEMVNSAPGMAVAEAAAAPRRATAILAPAEKGVTGVTLPPSPETVVAAALAVTPRARPSPVVLAATAVAVAGKVPEAPSLVVMAAKGAEVETLLKVEKAVVAAMAATPEVETPRASKAHLAAEDSPMGKMEIKV